ncbi:cell division protein FtsA [Anaeromicrobium sediminis]|uniref:SHS2 domain-containing protein n=1 Tax=Anaeromicrobium sediminis TaxID=1478221 RepID=A0A267MMX2_9FIRM|nr:cell division FtsA domain-containing protein [Anaeromicrobium sediminis]PAB60762.1 hypothetical protein CCE28_04280 [Anaeromicrobium sediminis]
MVEAVKGNINPHEVVFALDIGTKSVVGIVGRKTDEEFEIIDYDILKHPSRAMYDGQIHDVEKVAKTCEKVKGNLEERLGFKLKYVSIAAAGRALKTYKVKVEKEIDFLAKIDKSIVGSMEIEGVQRAQETLDSENKDKSLKYYCVGHTVVNYYLDDNIMTSLIDHKGNKISAEIIATFLPYVVVDSLYTVMNKIDLEVKSLTLEPIAAMNAAIPEKLRLLNIALVDIGAGTSDIALTKDGNVVAYAMASVAGDEITEILAKEFLLDFNMAEELKIQLNKKNMHTFLDIVGIEYTLTTEEILERIKGSIENLADNIAENILKYNKKAPSAVFCIGGGSQIPLLTEFLAQKLDIRPERVVVRGTEILHNVKVNYEELGGPEFITPIGIGTIGHSIQKDLIKITFNNNLFEMFKTKTMKVSDVLIKAGFSPNKLISKRGKSMEVFLGDEKHIISGQIGESAKIYLNGEEVGIDAAVSDKDTLVVKEALPGKDGTSTLMDFIHKLEVDGEKIKGIRVNNEKCELSYVLGNKDRINIEFFEDSIIKEPIQRDKGSSLKKKITKVYVNNEEIHIKKEKSPIFIDIFDYIDFDRSRVKGKLIMKVNDEKGSFTDVLNENDHIEIYWE